MNNKEKSLSYTKYSTRIYASILGVFVGLSGILHGIYEDLQGDKATEGFYLQSIGAVTMIPNYLITGIVTIIIRMFIIIWTIGYIQKKNGPLIILISCIL